MNRAAYDAAMVALRRRRWWAPFPDWREAPFAELRARLLHHMFGRYERR